MFNLLKSKLRQNFRIIIAGGFTVTIGFVIGFLAVPTLFSMAWDGIAARQIEVFSEDQNLAEFIQKGNEQTEDIIEEPIIPGQENNYAGDNVTVPVQANSGAVIVPKPASTALKTSTLKRLYVPAANIDIPIVEGTSEKVLFKGAWHSPYSSTPDKGGNTVIFGHRYYRVPPRKDTFYSLDKVKAGDVFEIVWEGKTYKYNVTEIKIVNPDDISVLSNTSVPSVTLITCTPLFTTKYRLVVRGELVP